ncbi:hypothetical protein [Staphylococcus simulans]|uniref:hypothetical protein n=1 Tax=Staphylococcus simulans TaxID=1286 RepID=UPI0018EA80FD|nr:hypothetical protein [Staphylococcus simulans]
MLWALLGYKVIFGYLSKNAVSLEMSGFARPTFFKGSKFPLCSYKAFWTKTRFRYFLQKFAPAGTKNRTRFLKDLMQNFSLHVTGQCLKIVTGFAQIFAFENSIYLFGSYLRFKSLYMFLGIKLPNPSKYPLKIQNKGI